MKPLRTLVFSIVLAVSLVPFSARAGVIGGTTAGSTVMAPGLTVHPNTRDDTNVASTIDMSFFTYCSWIVQGATAFPTYKFVFAGDPTTAGKDFKPIDPGDFTISQYKPWVVNNNPMQNFITPPGGITAANPAIARNVKDQDAGGANILITYTPLNNGDPTTVNFLQAFIQNTNKAGFTKGVIDNGGSPTPYYNDGGNTSGTGTNHNSVVDLMATKAAPAWMADVPGRCENGTPALDINCQVGRDETITSQAQSFQTFIESTKVDPNDGKTYQVLYGGVQWGYRYATADTPEPSSILLFGSPVFLAGLRRYFRRRN